MRFFTQGEIITNENCACLQNSFLHFIVRTPIHNLQLAKVPYEVYFYLLHFNTCINQIQRIWQMIFNE